MMLHRPNVRAGFTLVELIVVMGIVVFLMGLVAMLSTSLIRHSEMGQTETILVTLDHALLEWEALTDRKLTWGNDGTPPGATYDIQKSVFGGETTEHEEIFLITQVLTVITRPESVKSTIRQLPADLVHVYDDPQNPPPWINNVYGRAIMFRYLGQMTVIDPWSMPIYATHPGAPADPPDDADGTERTRNEKKYGVAINARMCFVSAGPDGLFGDLGAEPDSDLRKQTDDNIYSYPVVDPLAGR